MRKNSNIKKAITIAAVLALTLVLFTACGDKEAEAEPDENKEVITNFGEFKSVTHEGEEVTQEIFKNSDLTMINVWGTFCGPCLNEMPDLEKISNEYDKSEFQMIGLVSDKLEPGDPKVDEILEKTGVTYTQIMNEKELAQGTLAAVQAVPTTIFVDKEGEIVYVQVGGQSYDNWKAIIEQVMENM